MLKNFIYILQSENYHLGRFLKFVYTHPAWWKLENRQTILWTAKARILWAVSAVVFWGVIGLFFVIFRGWWFFIIVPLILLLPIVVGVAVGLFFPIDILVKRKRVANARKIILESGIIVIGITGSYGKTSTKEILAAILETNFGIIKTPENTNTLVGIADFIIKNKGEFKEKNIFIVEIGAYRRGDIQEVCSMVHPSYSILTGINESHLERFGSLENVVYGKFELPQNTSKLVLLNFDDKNIKENYVRFTMKNFEGVSGNDVENVRIRDNFEGLEFEWGGIKFKTSLLAEHNIVLILLCVKIAKRFSMSTNNIQKGVSNIKPVAHRLQPIHNAYSGVTVIDDSYNGNFDGFVSGVRVLKRASGRKIILTPGIVELGQKTKEVHTKLGELYAKNVDLVLLIKNKATNYIAEELQRTGFANFKIYKNTQLAHNDLKNILKRGDTILFQNDLTDNYF